MHLFCFIMQILGLWTSSRSKKSHIHNVFNICTVPVYQITILQSYYELATTEELASAMDCGGVSFAQRRYWIYVEILGFFVNMLQLVLFLFNQMDAIKGILRVCLAYYRCCTCTVRVQSDSSSEEPKDDYQK